MKSSKSLNKKLAIAVLLLMISIGYAILSANIKINGFSKIGNSKWDIHFENIKVNSGSVPLSENDSAAVITENNNTEVTYAVTLSKPGDFYEFTVDAVNKGTIDGMVNLTTNTMKIGNGNPIDIETTTLPKYLNYSATYEDGDKIEKYHELKAGDKETYKIRIEFKKDITKDDLPTEEQVITYTFGTEYIQSDDKAKSRYMYGFFNSDEIYTFDYIVNENCTASSYLNGLTDEEKIKYCNKEEVEGTYGTYSIQEDLLYDAYPMIKENVIDAYNLEIDNSTSNFKELKRNNFIKFKSNLKDVNLCTLYNYNNEKPTCFNVKNFEEEKTKLLNLFGENNCSVEEDEISCNADTANGEWECTISEDKVELEYSNDNYYDNCELDEDSFYCSGSHMKVDDDSPFITELTTEGLVPLSYDVNKNKCIKEYYSKFDDKEKTTAFCNGEAVEYDESIYTLRKEIIHDISYYEEEGIVKNVKYGKPTSYEINYEGCKNYLHNEGEEDEGQIELYCTGNTATIFGDEQNLKEMLDEELSIGETYELIEYENYGVININYQETKPNKIITGYEGTPPKDLVIPSTLNGGRVVEIGYGAFQDMGLESVVIPNTVTYIESYAFRDNNITQVNIPESVTYIGQYAFDNNKLNTVNLSNENANVNYCSFGKKKTITTHNLPDDYYCETIYWALQDNDSNSTNETLVISDSEVKGNKQGSFEGNKYFYNSKYVPWINSNYIYSADNLSYNVMNVKIEGEISPKSTAYWFNGVGYNAQKIEFDLNGLDTSNTENMNSMFAYAGYNASEFELNLSNFNTSKVTNMNNMFDDCRNLVKIYATSLFSIDQVYSSNNMFYGDTKLKGDAGTVYSDSHIDKEYAHIDGGTSSPGYFTKGGLLTVTLNPNGGKVTKNKIYYSVGEEIGALPTPIRDEYEFIGWYTGLEDGIKIDSDYIPSDDLQLYARWRDLHYTVIFDKNNESAVGEMNNQIVIENISTTLSKNNYSLEGYAFVGWNTERDGSGTSYLDKAEITANDNLTLYAQWMKTYTLTLDKNNAEATGNTFITYVLPGKSKKLLSSYYSKYQLEGKHIESYNSKSDNSGVSYYKGQTITISEDTTIYAQWEDLPPITETIYWAIKNNNKTLVISDEYVSGTKAGSVSGSKMYGDYELPPWLGFSKIAAHSTDTIHKNITEVKVEGNVVPLSTAYWFYDLGSESQSLTFDFTGLNTSRTLDMSYMFSNAGYNATTFNLDLSNLDTSNVTDMSTMFKSAGHNATTWDIGDLNNWDTSKVTNMASMFSNAGYNATTFNLDLSNLDTSNVTNMCSMFERAGYNATTWDIGDLSNWDTSNVTDMNSMFYQAGYNATTFNLDFSNWDTSKVTNMSNMFYFTAKNVTIFDLDLSNWDTSNVTKMYNMFCGAGYNSKVFNLNLSNWDTSNVTDMSAVFLIDVTPAYDAGYNATTWKITIPKTNGNGIINTTSIMYGSTTSNFADLRNRDRQFTLATD